MSVDDVDGHDTDDSGSGSTSRWDGYSDYRTISVRMASAISDALDAYSRIDSKHAESARVPPELAAELRSRIQYAVLELIPELQQDRDDVDAFDEILQRWLDGEGEEPGVITRLDGVQLTKRCPGWLFQVMIDLKTAGWELGYLQAGRVESEPDDPVEAETESMFEGM
jgi:hypothetical protein